MPNKGASYRIAGKYRIAGNYPTTANIPYDFGEHEGPRGGQITLRDDRQKVDDDLLQIILGRLDRLERVLNMDEYDVDDHSKYVDILIKQNEQEIKQIKAKPKAKPKPKAGTLHKASDRNSVQRLLNPSMLF